MCGEKIHNVSNFQLIIEDPWEKGKDSLLSIHFRPPFSVVPKMQTALTKKFLQLAFQANTEETSTFSVKNPQVSCENSLHTTLRLVNSPNEILVNKLSLYRKQMIVSSFFADSEASLGLQLYLGNFHWRRLSATRWTQVEVPSQLWKGNDLWGHSFPRAFWLQRLQSKIDTIELAPV